MTTREKASFYPLEGLNKRFLALLLLFRESMQHVEGAIKQILVWLHFSSNGIIRFLSGEPVSPE